MGCFSFLCKETGKGVESTSSSGMAVHLFLLKDGKVIEHMFGNYDSYGRVFDETKEDSFEWKMEWGDVCDLMFHKDNSNGIAAILANYWKEGDPFPTSRSKPDPNQGWGDESELLGDTSDDLAPWVEKPFHVYGIQQH